MKYSNLITKKDFFSKLSRILKGAHFECIYDLKISSEISTTLLYNTMDLWLNKGQFDALIDLVDPQDKIYIVHNDSDKVYEVCLPVSYEEYKSLNLFSMTFLSSSNFDWVVILDEGLESGMGVIAGNDEFIANFHSRYGKSLIDLQSLISFHYHDLDRNPSSLKNLIKVLSLLHIKEKGESALIS